MMSNDTITLYPTNWLYNASVIGFLESLKEIENFDVENWLSDEGTASIPRNIFENLDCDKRYFKDKLCRCIIIGKRPQNNKSTKFIYYPNYINPSRKKQDEKGFPYFVKELKNIQNSSSICGLCNQSYSFNDNSVSYLNSIWSNNSRSDFNKFFDNITRYSITLNSSLGSPISKFPNAFWNMKHSFSLCPLCAYLIIHSHIPFVSIKDGDIFINHSSFKVMWYLNRFLRNVLGKSNVYELKQILGLTLLEFAQKISTTLGIWSMVNIEMIIKRGDTIDYYSLPFNVVKILLDRDVALLLNKINEPYIFELILNEHFDFIIELNHELIKSVLDDKFRSDKGNYKLVSYLKDKSNKNRMRLLELLPVLYGKISEILNQRR